jgi:hypothetical protein
MATRPKNTLQQKVCDRTASAVASGATDVLLQLAHLMGRQAARELIAAGFENNGRHDTCVEEPAT